MSDSTPDTTDSDDVQQADVRNGEPDALEDVDVTDPGSDGEPIHHTTGGDIGEGAD